MVTLEEAQDIYRAAWHTYLLTEDDDRRQIFSDVMDDVQAYCVSTGGPGPEWDAFIDTLPSFREHWARWGSEMMEKMEKVEN